MTLRVLLADDQEPTRARLRRVLEAHADVVVVGEAADALEAVQAAECADADVALLDARLSGLNTVEATRRITQRSAASLHVLLLAPSGFDEGVYESLRAGAGGFVLKDAPASDLVRAIRTVARDDALVDPVRSRRLVERFVSTQPADAPSFDVLDALTERELEILIRIGRGRSDREIGRELGVVDAMVADRVAAILHKCGLRGRFQAYLFAYEHGLVMPRRRHLRLVRSSHDAVDD